MAAAPWLTGKVIKIEQHAEGTRCFFIEVPELNSFNFTAGQFVTLDLPIHEKPARRLRSYSIASAPDGTNVFELCIVLMDGGVGTKYLFEEVHEGSELTFRGGLGSFTLPAEIKKDLYFICTGTGIAPFRSMLNYIASNNVAHNNIYLIFGTRRRENLLYYDEMRILQEHIPHFHFIPTLSREEWEGQKGYVHQVYEEQLKKNITTTGPLEECGAAFYLCGWRDMIDEAKQRLIALGFDRKCIHQELYG